MKHPVRDRIVILFCSLCALLAAVAAVALFLGRITVDPAVLLLGRISNMTFKTKVALIIVAVVMVLFALRLFVMILPSRQKRSSNFAIQHNENGMVRISVKALESLVQRCLNQHAEIKVVSSSLSSDEERVRVDVHIALQADISMPLAISALQKQIKRYLEACSGVSVEEVRVFVDGMIPPSEATADSPYAIPASLLGREPLAGTKEGEPLLVEVDAVPAHAASVEAVEPAGDAPQAGEEAEEAAAQAVQAQEADAQDASEQVETGETA